MTESTFDSFEPAVRRQFAWWSEGRELFFYVQ
jgi:hypothetical protein